MKDMANIRIAFGFLFFVILIGFLGWEREAIGEAQIITDVHAQAYLRGYEKIGSIRVEGSKDKIFEEAKKQRADLLYLSHYEESKAVKGRYLGESGALIHDGKKL